MDYLSLFNQRKVLLYLVLSNIFARHQARKLLKLLDRTFISQEKVKSYRGAMSMFPKTRRVIDSKQEAWEENLEDFDLTLDLEIYKNQCIIPNLPENLFITKIRFYRSQLEPPQTEFKQDNNLLNTLSNLILKFGANLTSLEFKELEIVLEDLRDPNRTMTVFSRSIRQVCTKLQTIIFTNTYSIHILWDLLTEVGCLPQLSILYLKDSKLLNQTYIQSLLQTLNKSKRELTTLKLKANVVCQNHLKDEFLNNLGYKMFKNLTSLSLNNNYVRDRSQQLACILRTSQLKFLDLSQNPIRGTQLGAILESLPKTLITLKLKQMKDRFQYSDILVIAEFLQQPSCTLSELDVSQNYQANTKGFLALMQACLYNRHLKLLASDETTLSIEAFQSITYLIKRQQEGCGSVLQQISLQNSRYYDNNRGQFEFNKIKLELELLAGQINLRKVVWSSFEELSRLRVARIAQEWQNLNNFDLN